MYKQVKTHETAILDNGAEFKPVATLESEAGGVCHISIDDHCYKLTLKQNDGRFKVTPYIFGEALEVLRRLPPLILDIKTIKMDVLNTELEMETRNYNTETGELGPELNTDFQTEREIIENCLFRARQLHFDGKTPSDTSIKELEDELYDRLFSYRDNKKETPLDRPAAYSLIDIFKELKFGRPAASQDYLDKCIKELHSDSCLDSGDGKLPNFKFTPPAPPVPKDEYQEDKLKNYLRELIFKARKTGKSEYASECLREVNELINETFNKLFNIEEIKPYGYSEDETYEKLFNKKDDVVYGYILTAQHYEKAALAILGIESFLNSDGVHIRQPEYIEKLRVAGVLDNWFYPITEKDMVKFNANKIDEMSSGGKLMVKYLKPVVEQQNVSEDAEKSAKTAYSEKMPEGYILIKSEYETYVMSMIEKDGFFKNSENDVLILSPTNIEKLIQKGVLSDWFIPVFKYDSNEFVIGFPEGYDNMRVTIDGYFGMEKLVNDKCHLIKFKLPTGNWDIYQVNGDNHTVTLYTKTLILGSQLRPFNRIQNLAAWEERMSMDELGNDLTNAVYKYLHPEISVRDMKLTLRIIEDVIKNPQFYLNTK